MEVYVVISEFDEEKIVERVYGKEQDAIDYCKFMNRESLGFYYCSTQQVR